MATATKNAPMDELISADEVKVASRGRSVELDPTLVSLFERITDPSQAARLSNRFGSVEREKRQTVSATIRKNWKHVHPDVPCKIDYGNDGVPQVRYGKVKSEA